MRWVAVIAAVLTGAVLAVIAGINAANISSLSVELSQARAQLARVQQAGQQARAQVAADRAALAAAEARIGGTHRDLITCSDWQSLYMSVSGVDSFGGSLSASAGPASLPSHCINQ